MSKNKIIKNKVKKILDTIGDDRVAKQYFYTKTDIDESWFDELNSARAFDIKNIPGTYSISDQIYYYNWVEGEYLLKIASKVPNKIFELLNEYDTSTVENPIIKETLLEILCVLVLELEESSTKKLVNRVASEKWFESRHLNLMAYKLEDLVKALCKKKNYRTLIDVLPCILKLQKPYDDSKVRHEPVSLFESHTYQAIINQISKLVFEPKERLKLQGMLGTILDLLHDHIKLNNNIYSYSSWDDDTSLVWKPSLATDKPDSQKDLDESLLDVAKNLMMLNIGLIDIDFLKKIITKWKYTIFKRLALFSVIQIEYRASDVFELISKLGSLESVKTELRKVLEVYFKKFTKTQKGKILNKINSEYDLNKILEEKRFLLEDGRVKDEDELKRILSIYIVEKKSEYLLPIASDLSIENKEQFKAELLLKDNYRLPLSSSKSGFMSGPNSRLSIEVIKGSTVEEIVKKLKDDAVWYIEHPHNTQMNSPLGVAHVLLQDIKDRPAEYLRNLNYFKPNKLLPPVYICYLFNGFEASLKQNREDLSPLMEFLDVLLQQFKLKSLPKFPVQDDFDTGSWEGVLVAILRFFDSSLQLKGAIDAKYEHFVISIVEFCLSYKSELEIRSEEEKYSNKDYYTHCINSLYGLALHCSVQHAIWREGEGLVNQPITNNMKMLITGQLKRKVKTAFSVFGHYYPTFFYFDQTFAKKIKPILFSNKSDSLSYTAFESYLTNDVYSDVVTEIKDNYATLLKSIPNIPKSEYGRGIQEKLVEHVMISYVHELPAAEYLKKLLFQEEGPHRQYAIAFIGRAYVSAAKNESPRSVKHKIKKLWEESLKSKNLVYGRAFGWWLNSSFFNDDIWMLKMFIETLQKTGGVIGPDFKVLRSLADLSKKLPHLCLMALNLMVMGEDKDKVFYFRDKEILEIIENAESQNDSQLNETAEKIRNELVKYGFLQYK